MRTILTLWLAVGVSLTSLPRACPGQGPSASGPQLGPPLSVAYPAQQKTPSPAQKTGSEDFSLDLPKPEKLFLVQSEAALREEIREHGRRRGVKKTEFPQDARPSMPDRTWIYPPMTIQLPAAAVCFRTLYFEDVNRERGLKSWGIAEPLRECSLFYGTILTLPARMVINPPWRYQCWQYPFIQ